MSKTKDMVKMFVSKEDLEEINKMDIITTYGEYETVVMDVEPWRVMVIMVFMIVFSLMFFSLMIYMAIVFPYSEIFNIACL